MAINAHTNDLLIHINSLHISALVYHSKACFMLSLQYQIETVKYTTKQRMFLYNTYERNELDKFCKRRFCHKYYSAKISASSTIFELVNKACSAGSSSDKKCTRQKAVLTEEKLDKTVTRLEHSPHKSLTWLKCYVYHHIKLDRLCGLVVRVSGYRSRGPGFDSRPYQIFWEVGGLERGPLSLVRTIEELIEWKSSSCGLENQDSRPWEFVVLTTQHSLPANVGTNFTNKQWLLGQYSSLVDYGHRV
jgi:hypothetical protein